MCWQNPNPEELTGAKHSFIFSICGGSRNTGARTHTHRPTACFWEVGGNQWTQRKPVKQLEHVELHTDSVSVRNREPWSGDTVTLCTVPPFWTLVQPIHFYNSTKQTAQKYLKKSMQAFVCKSATVHIFSCTSIQLCIQVQWVLRVIKMHRLRRSDIRPTGNEQRSL